MEPQSTEWRLANPLLTVERRTELHQALVDKVPALVIEYPVCVGLAFEQHLIRRSVRAVSGTGPWIAPSRYPRSRAWDNREAPF